MLSAFCDDDPKSGYAVIVYNGGDLIRSECTEEQYLKAKEFIENYYPGVCTFDENIL